MRGAFFPSTGAPSSRTQPNDADPASAGCRVQCDVDHHSCCPALNATANHPTDGVHRQRAHRGPLPAPVREDSVPRDKRYATKKVRDTEIMCRRQSDYCHNRNVSNRLLHWGAADVVQQPQCRALHRSRCRRRRIASSSLGIATRRRWPVVSQSQRWFANLLGVRPTATTSIRSWVSGGWLAHRPANLAAGVGVNYPLDAIGGEGGD